jgi:hypothetical protein
MHWLIGTLEVKMASAGPGGQPVSDLAGLA